MRTETSDFWVGSFESEHAYFNFFGENNEDFYKDDTEEEKFISEFAKSQGESWIDHDFMESGFENGESAIDEKFSSYSYSHQWLPELKKAIERLGLTSVNTIAFITKGQINTPTSVQTDYFTLTYVGRIQYEI